MKYYYTLLTIICFFQYSLSYSSNQNIEYDSVSIVHMPSKDAHHKGEPQIVYEAKTLAHHKNSDIKRFFITLNSLASEGITDNATQFHKPTVYIEAVYQKKQIRLFFSGDSNLDTFKSYEKQWQLLHSEIFQYLNTKALSINIHDRNTNSDELTITIEDLKKINDAMALNNSIKKLSTSVMSCITKKNVSHNKCFCLYPNELYNFKKQYESALKNNPEWRNKNIAWSVNNKSMTHSLSFPNLRKQAKMKCEQ